MDKYYKSFENFLMNIQIEDYPEQIRDRVKYLLQDGKRLRPILCIIFSGIDIDQIEQIENHKFNTIYKIACCIETIHCLSLVLDDLPSMDNDNIRRDKQSFHYKYGENYTNFFIYYMFNRIGLSLNIEEDSDKSRHNDKSIITLCSNIHKIVENNLNMLIDGQYIDLEWTTNKTTEITNGFRDEITIIKSLLNESVNNGSLDNGSTNMHLELIKNIELNMKKTSSLFNLSISIGYLLQNFYYSNNENNENNKNYESISKTFSIWANILGYMFQISDDILDIDSDLAKNKPNICQIIGKEKTIILLTKGCEWLKNMISMISMISMINNINMINLDLIKEIINKILKRIEKN